MSIPTPGQLFKKPSPVAIAVIILGAILVALLGAAGFYTDFLWFDQLGFRQVLTTNILAQAGMFLVAALTLGLISWASFYIAWRTRPIYLKFADERDTFGQYRELLDQLRKIIMFGLPAVLGIFGGIAAARSWPTALAWFNRTYTGETDPQFGLDVGFYLFDLPFLTAVVGFFSAALLLAAVIGAVVHLIYGNIRFNGRASVITKPARIQVGISAFLYLALQGVSLWLDQYSTMTSDAGLFTGATYQDVNAVIPGFQILAMISFVVAILFLIAAVMGNWRLPILGTALMVISSMVLGGLYPWIVQTFQVVPNERTLEAPFIKRNIDATRTAYGLDDVEVVAYDAKTDAQAGALRKDAETTANIRIIDPALVSASFRQLEQYKQYYNFTNHLDVDRYEIEGKTQDTVIAVRELKQSGLGDSQSWYNNVIVYTHGYGVVAAYGNQRSTDGQPVFLQKGIPSTGALGSYEPRIYFGESSPTYSIVGGPAGTEPRELDYPAGEGEADQTYTTFKGNGGPKLDNIFARLAYALKFQSEQILLSDAISNESQILYNRDPRERISAVAPYLTLDSDPYPAVVDSKVVWIVDGYTTSANYPYSKAQNFADAIADSNSETIFGSGSINYIRNSVKATVDAYDGSVKLYAWDETDPILTTWSKIYPGSLSPISEMSADLISHVRYPSDLFKVQRAVLGSYHVTDPGSFYSQEDAWMTPNDPVTSGVAQSLQPPYYLTMQAPGTSEPQFSIYSTFIPRSTGESSRNVLKGYLVASSDAGSTKGAISSDYGKLRLLTLPSDSIVPGPGQVQNAFNADSEVSRLLNILSQGSTRVLKGNLLTLPVGGGLLYVQPVYIQSTGETSFPLLKKVLVAFGDQIAFEDTLDAALDVLFGGDSGANAGDGTDPVVPDEENPGAEEPSAPATNANLSAALERARKALLAKQSALAEGDWTAFGAAEAALQKAIEDAIAASR
ncbi:MAG: hypothetical protein RIR16_724 [Actinomycetota bacterium]